MITLIDKLRSLGYEASKDIHALNSGGCCVYAANVALAIQEAGHTVWGVASGMDADKINLNSIKDEHPELNEVIDWNHLGVSFGHVLVQFEYENKIWTHDSNNTICTLVTHDPTYRGKLYSGYLTVEDMLKLAKSQYGWNRIFQRSTGIPAIKKLVAKYLKTHENDYFSYRSNQAA